jgi:hypothetical protein
VKLNWRSLADRYAVAVVYTSALAIGSVLLHAQPPYVRAYWLDWASTNLANAPDHAVSTLVLSAFLTNGEVRWWLLLSLVALGAVGFVFGAWRTALLAAGAHLLGTVISEGILGYRVFTGVLPDSYRHIQDIGPSYVVAGALVAGIAYARWPGRMLCGAGFAFVAPSLFTGLLELEVSAVGHVTAILVALAIGGGFVLARRNRRYLVRHQPADV